MATLSQGKHFSKVRIKNKKSPLESHTTDANGHLLVSYITNDFLFLVNNNTKEVRKLFPVNKLTYLDFEILSDGSFLFVISDINGLTCQVRNFEKGTLYTHTLDIDARCNPSIIRTEGLVGVYFSYDGRLYLKPYIDGDLGENQLIAEILGQYMHYAAEEGDSVKIVTKVSNHDMIHPGIINTERREKDFTYVPLEAILEKKDG